MFKLLLLGIFVSTSTLAARDSIAYFYTDKKVNILLNERGYNSRISGLMEAVGHVEAMLLVSDELDMKLGCAVADIRSTCTFTFFPSKDVQFVDKKLLVKKELASLGIDPSVEFEMTFQGSMKDHLTLRLTNGFLTIFASK